MSTRIQSALMRMGTQIMGVIQDADDLEYLAKQFVDYDPYWEKKREAVWMKMESIPMLAWFGGSMVAQPEVIDHRTVEFTLDEQRELLRQAFKRLHMGEFLVKVAQGEGNVAGTLRKMSIAEYDPELYPDDAALAPVRNLLAQWHGFSREALLSEINARLVSERPQKELPTTHAARAATMDTRPYVHPDNLSSTGESGDALSDSDQTDKAEAVQEQERPVFQ
jgi:hypothetical protein